MYSQGIGFRIPWRNPNPQMLRFLMLNDVVWSTLCSHKFCIHVFNPSWHVDTKDQLYNYILPQLQPWKPLIALHHYSFVFLRMLFKCDYNVCNLLNLTSHTQCNIFGIHPNCVYQWFIPFYCWVVFHYMDVLHFAYPFMNWRAFGLLPIFGNYE